MTARESRHGHAVGTRFVAKINKHLLSQVEWMLELCLLLSLIDCLDYTLSDLLTSRQEVMVHHILLYIYIYISVVRLG